MYWQSSRRILAASLAGSAASAMAWMEGRPETPSRLRTRDFPLAQHSHGKSKVRVLKVRRGDTSHSVSEYTVKTKLFSEEYGRTFTDEDNTDLVATDTQKNTVYVVAKRSPCRTPEELGLALAAHFLKEYPILTATEITVEETRWERAHVPPETGAPAFAHVHGFLRAEPERARATIRQGRGAAATPRVTSEIRSLVLLKTTKSGFEGYHHDKYTLLPDTTERCLATELNARWEYARAPPPGPGSGGEPDFAATRAAVRSSILQGFFGPPATGVYSASLQATIYDGGCVALRDQPHIRSLHIETPNLHYIPFRALDNMGERFEDDVFVPTSEPSGSIEMEVVRDGGAAGAGARPVATSRVPGAGAGAGDCPAVAAPAGTAVDTAALERDIHSAIINKKAIATPMAIRLAWHASGTFDKADGSGGSDGATMRFAPESADDANAGLSIMRDLLKPVCAAHPEVSVADVWAHAGAAAVAFAGGPRVPVAFGRADAASGHACPPNGRLPDAAQGAAHLRAVFGRMGFSDREIVALSGGHTLGRCHPQRSGFDGPWTSNPLKFDNEYFVNLVGRKWRKRVWEGNEQYEDESGELMMLPTDMALVTDPKFRRVAQEYAKDEALFFREFAAAYAKLLANGVRAPAPASAPGSARGPAAGAAGGGARAAATHAFLDRAMHGHFDRLKAVRGDADVHATEPSSGRTALHKAAFWGHEVIVEYLLHDCEIDPNRVDGSGDTALHDAARFGHIAVVRSLLAAGADTRVANGDGQTALQVAQAYDKPEVAALLRRAARGR
eukprot:g2110.t1